MLVLGFDAGNYAVKAVAAGNRIHFPSAVGTPSRASFSLRADRGIVLRKPGPFLVGAEALLQSAFWQRPDGREWLASDGWYALFCAAVAQATDLQNVTAKVVAGLPCLFHERDKGLVRQRLLGEHRIEVEGRRPQVIRVEDCRVIKQPQGAVLSEALDDGGNIVDPDLQDGRAGVIDIGGGTSNFAVMDALGEIEPMTGGIDQGMWHVVQQARQPLQALCPELSMKDHDIASAMAQGCIRYFNRVIPLGDLLDEIAGAMAEHVVNAALAQWKEGGASVQQILITGGGAHLLGPYIVRRFPHARVVRDPVFANADGYWKLARRIAAQ